MTKPYLRLTHEALGLELKINSENSFLFIPFARNNIHGFKFNTEEYQYFTHDNPVGDTDDRKVKNIRPIIKRELIHSTKYRSRVIDYIFEKFIDPFMIQCYDKIVKMRKRA